MWNEKLCAVQWGIAHSIQSVLFYVLFKTFCLYLYSIHNHISLFFTKDGQGTRSMQISKCTKMPMNPTDAFTKRQPLTKKVTKQTIELKLIITHLPEK